MSDNTLSSSGIGITGVLGIVFVVLKLVGVIDWSWWWVLSPFWIHLAFVLVVLAMIALVAGAVAIVTGVSAGRTVKRMMREP